MSPDALNPERVLLGAAMTFKSILDNVAVDPADFEDVRYGALWSLMVDMHAKGEPTTATAVLGALKRIPKTDRVGIDGSVLFDLAQTAPVTANEGERAARDVTGDATLRRLALAGRRIVQLAEAGGDAAEIHEHARAEIDATHRATAEVHWVRDSIEETIDSLDKEAPSMPTPWEDLNRLIGGWLPGALYVVAARPAVGKSIIGLQAAVGLCDHGAVAFNSLEMSKREINQRLIAQMAEVPLGRLKGKSATSEPPTERDWAKIGTVLPTIHALPLAVDDNAGVTTTDIRAHARSIARTGKLAGVVVDYLQLMESAPGDRRSRQEVVAGYSRALKLLAKELDVPVIALAQLNRELTKRQSGRPAMSDLRESGAIEQDADVIILLHSEEESDDLDLGVAKNRHGVTGAVRLTRQGEFARAVARTWRPSFVPNIPTAYADN